MSGQKRPPADLTVPYNHLPPLLSAIVVYGLLTPLLLGFVVPMAVSWLRSRLKSSLARKALDPSQPLTEGEIVVSGVVELLSGRDRAVTVEVEQQGSEREISGRWLHFWEEVDRRIHVEPFYLRHASGERLRVEPSAEAVQLVDDLDGVVWIDLAKRVRVAELVPGKEVVVHGRLARGQDPDSELAGYRGGVQVWVLTPPASGPMLLSSKALGHLYDVDARYFKRLTVVFVALFAVVQIMFVKFHLASWAAETVTATVTDAREQTTSNDDGTTFSAYELTVSAPEHGVDELSERVREQAYKRFTPGSTVPIRAVPWFPSASQLGRGATIAVESLAIFLAAPLPIVLFILAWVFRPRPWYAHQIVEGGISGKLPRTDAERQKSFG